MIVSEDAGPMKPTMSFGFVRLGATRRARAIWIALIVASGICLSTIFACVTPFAALATLAALKLARRDSITVVGAVWLANQAAGYGFLGYQWNWDSAAWGIAIGVSDGLAVPRRGGCPPHGLLPWRSACRSWRHSRHSNWAPMIPASFCRTAKEHSVLRWLGTCF
jgi:hypothetical protein